MNKIDADVEIHANEIFSSWRHLLKFDKNGISAVILYPRKEVKKGLPFCLSQYNKTNYKKRSYIFLENEQRTQISSPQPIGNQTCDTHWRSVMEKVILVTNILMFS